MPEDNMEDKLAAQEETIAALQKQVESIPDLMKKISELTAAQRANAIESAVDKVVLPSIPEKPISYNKKKYKWVLPVFSLPGVGRVTAEEAATDEGIVKAILDIDGQGILRELV